MCAGGCIDSVHTQVVVKLNANSIPSSTSLVLNITSKSFPHVSKKALVDSSSTHCFLDHSLVQKFRIPTHSISPIPLNFLTVGPFKSFLQLSQDLKVNLFGLQQDMYVGAHMLICIYAQSQSKYISVFSSIYSCITFISLFVHRSNFFRIFPYFSCHFIHFKSLSF